MKNLEYAMLNKKNYIIQISLFYYTAKYLSERFRADESLVMHQRFYGA